MRYFRYGHIDKVKVKKGDKITKGQLIAQNGTGNGQWYAHCHFDILTYLPASWTNFVIGQSLDWVKGHYADPRGLENVVMPTFDHLGYGWLEEAQYSGGKAFHSGVDLNGQGSGNADLDDPLYSSCNGTVVYCYNGNENNSGWGKLLVIEEEPVPTDASMGIDISHYQGEVDWGKVTAKFVIQKCSQGTSFVDGTYLKNKQGAKGIQFGSYHFADGGDAQKEVEHFLKTVGEIREGDLLVLDWEIQHTDTVKWCKSFLDEVFKRTGVKPFIYLNSATAKAFDWSSCYEYPLWLANYGVNDGTFHANPSRGNWPKEVIHQFTSRGTMPGIVGNVDLNIAYENLINYGNKTMDKNYKKLFEEVADFLNKDYGDNLDDKDVEDIKTRFKGFDEEHDVLEKNIDIQAEKIKNQSEQINALGVKLKEKEASLQDFQAAAEKNFEAVSVIRLFQEAFKKLINFK